MISEGVGVNQLAQIYLILDPIFDSDPQEFLSFESCIIILLLRDYTLRTIFFKGISTAIIWDTTLVTYKYFKCISFF